MRCFIIGVLTTCVVSLSECWPRALFHDRSVGHARCFIIGVLTTRVVSLSEC